MEGLTNCKDVKNYEILSFYYDYLLQDEDSLVLWLKYIEEKEFNTCLELASGSGVMAGILERKGYKVIASDLSNEMKKVSINNFKGDYRIINMTDYDLDEKFDLILCICDSINYLNEYELSKFFSCCKKHLNPNGRLIFDMHNTKRINEFKDEYVEEGKLPDGNFYQWTISSDSIEKTIHEHFTFYVNGDMIQEHHTQNVFEPSLIERKMYDAGYKVRIIEDFVPFEKLLVIGEL